jgi:hypothetical protein
LTFVFQRVPANEENLYFGDEVTSVSGAALKACPQPFKKRDKIPIIMLPQLTFLIRHLPAKFENPMRLAMCTFYN